MYNSPNTTNTIFALADPANCFKNSEELSIGLFIKEPMTFAELLKIKKKHLKPASIDTYLRNIKRLRKVYHDLPIPDSSVSWLSEKKLFTWFDKEPLNVRRHLATAANVAFSVLEKKNKEWATRQNIAMKEFDSDRRARKLTDKQKKMQMPEDLDERNIDDKF